MLDLDALDKRILYHLKRKVQSATDLERTLRTKRTTIHWRLTRLQRRKLVEPVPKRADHNARLWRHSSTPLAQRGHILTFSGTSFHKARHILQRQPAGTIMYVIQGTRSPMKDIRSVPRSRLEQYHLTQKRKRFVLRGLINQQLLKVFQSADNNLLKSFLGRSVHLNVCSSPHLLANAGIIIATPRVALLINTEKARAVVIRDVEMTHLLYEILGLMFETIEYRSDIHTLDYNEFIRSILTKREREDG